MTRLLIATGSQRCLRGDTTRHLLTAPAATWGPSSLPQSSDIKLFCDTGIAGSVTDVSGKASVIIDQVSGRNLAQGTDANRPTTGANRNGRPVVTFTANSGMDVGGGATGIVSKTSTFFVVAAPAGSVGWGGPFLSAGQATGTDDNGGAGAFAVRTANSNPRLIYLQDGGSADTSTGTNSWSVYTVEITAATATVYQDGASIASRGGVGGATVEYWTIGLGAYLTAGAWSYGSGFTGDLAALIVYNATLSGADRATVEAALKARWATP